MKSFKVIEYAKKPANGGGFVMNFLFDSGFYGSIDTRYGNNLTLRGVNGGIVNKGKNYASALAAINEFLTSEGV